MFDDSVGPASSAAVARAARLKRKRLNMTKLKFTAKQIKALHALPTPIPRLKAAAATALKDIRKHFKTDGYDLDFSMLKDELFYEAFGHHLENYILAKLPKGVALTAKSDKVATVLTKYSSNGVVQSSKKKGQRT